MQRGSVPRLTKELCAVMVCGLTSCTPLLVEHRRNARDLGATASMLTAIWDNARSALYTPAQKAALAAAVALTREPRALPVAVWDALTAEFRDEQIAELLCAIGLANYRTRLVNGFMPRERAQERARS